MDDFDECNQSSRPQGRVLTIAQHIAPMQAKSAMTTASAPLSGVGTLVVDNPQGVRRSGRNWGGQIMWGAEKITFPTTVEELQALCKNTDGDLRVVGRGHSFSPVCAVPGGTLINLVRFSEVVGYVPPSVQNNQQGTVRFEAGATFAKICHFLSEQSPPTALKQIPSPLFVTIAGALATGTHGSGINTKAIAAHVQDIEFVGSDGELRRYDRGPSGPDTVVAENVAGGHVGCLGVVSRMSLDVVPYFEGHNFWLWMPITLLLEHWDELTGDLHLGGIRRPLVDSHSILVWWNAGVCVINAKHFFPHYNPAVGCKPPAWGDHPFGARDKWDLITPTADTLEGTLSNAGVRLSGASNDVSTVVAEVEPGSLAAESGVKPGWTLTHFGSKRVSTVNDVVSAFAHAGSSELVTGSGQYTVAQQKEMLEGDTSMAGKEPKVRLRFKNKHASPDSSNTLPSPWDQTVVNHAYRGPWHDTVPAWALDQPIEDGPDCDCGQQSEFFLPMENAVPALTAAWEVMRHWSVAPSREHLDKGCFVVSEIRSIKGCDGWVSCTPRDTMSIHLSWSPAPSVQDEIWREIIKLEEALAPFGARPHWGKIYTASFWAPKFPKLYGEGMRRFKQLAKRHDPCHQFATKWIRETMFTELD